MAIYNDRDISKLSRTPDEADGFSRNSDATKHPIISGYPRKSMRNTLRLHGLGDYTVGKFSWELKSFEIIS